MQHRMIECGEMLHDVQPQHPTIGCAALQPIERAMRAFAEPVGIAVGNEVN